MPRSLARLEAGTGKEHSLAPFSTVDPPMLVGLLERVGELARAAAPGRVSLFEPLTGNRLTSLQREIMDKDFDQERCGVRWSWHSRYCREEAF
jgi:hypothetical protein